jgi:hypothetical protein
MGMMADNAITANKIAPSKNFNNRINLLLIKLVKSAVVNFYFFKINHSQIQAHDA